MTCRPPASLLRNCAALLFAAAAAHASFAQFGSPPVAESFSSPIYPPIARAAHVSGDVVVRFSIQDDGSASQVQVVSGPPMLQNAAADAIKRWRFSVPLPMGAQHDFEARFHFKFNEPSKEVEQPDDLDGPPNIPTGGDYFVSSIPDSTITSDVHSTDGSQTIQPPRPSAASPACPANPQPNTPPTSQTLRDFIELARLQSGSNDPSYRVRIVRDGSVEWEGRSNVSTIGPNSSRIPVPAAQKIFDLLNGGTFWAQCPITLDVTPEDTQGELITAQIGTVHKTVYTAGWSSFGTDKKYSPDWLGWAIDKAADTHQWRHGDPAFESFKNMREDIMTPKPGMTVLIRAVLRDSWEDTTDAFDKLLATGLDVNGADSSGWTPLMYAVGFNAGGKLPLALLKAHAAVNRRSARGDTALTIAAYRGTLDNDLLAAGADINLANNAGTTTLMLLAQRGDPAVLKSALAAGANARARDDNGRTALDYLEAAACGKPVVLLEPPPQHYDDDGNLLPPPPLPPCPSTQPVLLEDEVLLRTAMQASPER